MDNESDPNYIEFRTYVEKNRFMFDLPLLVNGQKV